MVNYNLNSTHHDTTNQTHTPGKSTLADRMLEITGTIPIKQISRDRMEQDTKNEQ
jgi:translation elongation factor EF-4